MQQADFSDVIFSTCSELICWDSSITRRRHQGYEKQILVIFILLLTYGFINMCHCVSFKTRNVGKKGEPLPRKSSRRLAFPRRVGLPSTSAFFFLAPFVPAHFHPGARSFNTVSLDIYSPFIANNNKWDKSDPRVLSVSLPGATVLHPGCCPRGGWSVSRTRSSVRKNIDADHEKQEWWGAIEVKENNLKSRAPMRRRVVAKV